MTSFFLRAKHWQLALLFYGVPIVLYIIAFTVLISMMSTRDTNDVATIFLSILTLAIIIATGSLFYWFWTMGTQLHAKLPAEMPMPLQRFKLFVLFPVIYIALLFAGITLMVSSEQNLDGEPVTEEYVFLVPLFILCHAFAIFCIFYQLYYIAKSLKAVLLQREVHFSDYAGEFFLLWFHFVGIWLIQPKINDIFREGRNDDHWTPVIDQ